jgi:hypothetical protein
VIRLAKDAIKETGDPVISSFNVEALALVYITEIKTIAESLQTLFVQGAADLARRQTPDPAGVSQPIKMLAPHDEVVRRTRFFAEQLTTAIDNRDDKDKVREALAAVFPNHITPPTRRRPRRGARQTVRGATRSPARARLLRVLDAHRTLRPRRRRVPQSRR